MLPDANYCILRVNKAFDGAFQGSEPVSSHTCETGAAAQETRQFSSSMTWRITTSLDCDESGSFFPVSQLTAKGTTIVREDGFAHFIGTFSIVKQEHGELGDEIFLGTMELIGRTGSHQALNEKCDEAEHIEGWLVGRSVNPVPEYSLRLLIVAKGQLTEGSSGFLCLSVNRMTGTLMQSL